MKSPASRPFSNGPLRVGGRLLGLETPVVMGVLNLTPDSFFGGSKVSSEKALVETAARMLAEGAAILDLGGMSTRPGAATVPPDEELARVLPAVNAVIREFPDAVLSIDTVHAVIAEAALDAGAAIVNDISAGQMDKAMWPEVARLQVPYVLMHMQGTPATMQQEPHYVDVAVEVLDFFIRHVAELRALGVKDIIIDPGFGFGKTVEHNYSLLSRLGDFRMIGCPIMVGLSRKSMVNKVIGSTPDTALNGTTVLHTMALERGASILRVHDVKEAVEAVKLVSRLGASPRAPTPSRGTSN